MRRRHGGTGLHSPSTCGNEVMARCRELFPRCASCGNAGSVQAVALRLKINQRRGAEGTHDARNSPRGAPRGQRQDRRPPSRGAHVAPGAAGQNKAIRGASAGGFRLSPSPRLRVNLLNRAQLAPAGRFINRPVYCDDSRISDHTPTFAKRAGILPAVLRATNSVCSATPNPT